MKTKSPTVFLSIKKLFESIKPTGGLVSLANSFELAALFRVLGWRLVFACFPGNVKVVTRLNQLKVFQGIIRRMVRHHGADTTVKFLKACQLAVQKRIAEDRIDSLRDLVPDLPLPRLSTSGLPRFIPLRDRRAILSGSVPVIRWWLTLFSVYRVLQIPGELKLSTITTPYTGSVEALGRACVEIATVSRDFKHGFPGLSGAKCELQLLETSSPTSRVSWLGLLRDPFLLKELGMMEPIRALLGIYGATKMDLLFRACLSVATDSTFSNLVTAFSKTHYVLSNTGRALRELDVEAGRDTELTAIPKDAVAVGQLSTKAEAAGKIRVFAMVDIWTQSVLKPLHDRLFTFLSHLPNDGTFDQSKSVKRGAEKAVKTNCSFGFDLSAATDRLPITLQVSILHTIYGKELADNWKKLLVGRDYILPEENDKKGNLLRSHESLRYSVGQPMGALSSWAMLAVTHHFLVQIAFRRVSTLVLKDFIRVSTWFEGYELLGDDIVIFDKHVADSYLALMEELGVGINLSKSVVARNGTSEFAKVTMFKSQNVSAISWKMFISQNTFMGRANIAFSLLRKSICTTHAVRWVMSFTRHTRASQGRVEYTLFAILSMFVNSKILEINSLLASAIPKEISAFSDQYASLLKGLDSHRLKSMLAAIVSGKGVQPTPKLFEREIFKRFMIGFEQVLRDKVNGYVRKLNLDALSKILATDIMRVIAPTLPKGVTRFYRNIDEYPVNFRAYNIVFSEIERLLRAKLFLFPLPTIAKGPGSVSITELLADCEKVDRNLELEQIVVRAMRKLEKTSVPIVADSPLANLILTGRAAKRAMRTTITGALIPTRKDRRRGKPFPDPKKADN